VTDRGCGDGGAAAGGWGASFVTAERQASRSCQKQQHAKLCQVSWLLSKLGFHFLFAMNYGGDLKVDERYSLAVALILLNLRIIVKT